MTFRSNVQIAKGLIDPAPLVDVVFLLLLFFVLSSPFVMQTGFGVVLPTSNIPTTANFQGLVVTVTRDNLLFFNNQPITMEALENSFHRAVQQGRGRELIIKADKQVTHGTVVQIMGLAIKAGISVVNLATRVETPAGVGAP